MVDMLGFISDQLDQLGIPYEFGEWTGEISYPYFVGSFNETEHRLDATVRTVLKQDNEDKQWDLYCAITANPLADDVGNFEEFKQRFMSTAPKGEKTEQTEPTINNAQIKLQVEKANKILNGFVPPLKGGG